MQPAHFRQAVRNRLFIPHPGEAEVAGKPCTCPGAYNVDGLGLHMQKCKLEARLTIDMHKLKPDLSSCIVDWHSRGALSGIPSIDDFISAVTAF